MSASTLRLRRLAEGDLERVMHWRMSPDVTRHMYTSPQLTMADQRRWFERLSVSARDRVWIAEIDAARPVGVVSLSEIDPPNRRCAWAYYLGEADVRGRGLGKPIECNICDHVFDHLGFNRLWCEVLASNPRVVELHQRFGSQVEGVLRQHVFKEGRFHDVVRMAILKDEWHALRGGIDYPRIAIE